MKNKVRACTAGIIAVMAFALCTGCSGNERVIVSNDNSISADNNNQSVVQEDISSDASDAGSEDGQKKDTAAQEITIEEQVLVEQDNIKITATGYIQDSIWGDGIKLLIENNTDKNIVVGCNALIVNDYMVTDLFAADVAAGKKANENVYILSEQLKSAGINTVGKVDIYFHVYDADTWDNIFDTDDVEIRTSQYDNMDNSVNDAGLELYNDNDIRIVGKTVTEDSIWGAGILLYIENNSGRNIDVSVDDMSINGYMMTPFFSTSVYSMRKSIDEITVFSSDLERNGIESIDEVELTFTIYDDDTYETIVDTDPITFAAQ